MKIFLWLVAPALLIATLFVIFAPGFLFMDNIPRKAETVVLFVGPGNESRLGEAKQLIKDGYARYLIIPSYNEILLLNSQGELERISGAGPKDNLILRVRIAAVYKKYYENTHIEALEAKRMMDYLGLKSAMLVSSAYHMRRVKLIADRVFDAREYAVNSNPARWQAAFTADDWFNRERRKIIVSEYAKILWLLVYGLAGS